MLIADIINNILFYIYIVIWKKLIKKIIFIITGTHQIERILKSDIHSYSTYIKLSN